MLVVFSYIKDDALNVTLIMQVMYLCIAVTLYLFAQYRKPVPFPCFGVLKKEKHVLLPSVADVVIEQGKKC